MFRETLYNKQLQTVNLIVANNNTPLRTPLYRTNNVYQFPYPLEDCIFNTNNDKTTLFPYLGHTLCHHSLHRLTCHLSNANIIRSFINKHIIENQNTLHTNLRQILVDNTKILYIINGKKRHQVFEVMLIKIETLHKTKSL